MKSRLKMMAKKPEVTHCEQCLREFTPDSEGTTIRCGEYLTRGMTWFCGYECYENYVNKNGY